MSEIGPALDDPAWDLHGAIGRHLAELDRRLDATGRLRGLLVHLLDATRTDAPTSDDLLAVPEAMTMLDAGVQRRISFPVHADIAAAYRHLVDVFGLGPGQLRRDADGRIIHNEIQAGDGVIWLHPESDDFGLASPRSIGKATAGVAIMVEDVDAHFRHAVERGATVDYGPVDQPYGYREYSARDNEGGLWSFMQPLD